MYASKAPALLLFAMVATSCASVGVSSYGVPVQPCGLADSLLGPRGRDPGRTLNGKLYRINADRDLLLTGVFEDIRPVQGRLQVRRGAHGEDPGTALDVRLRGAVARDVRAFGQPLGASLVLDDTLTIPVGLALAGQYDGPDSRIILPVRFDLPLEAVRALARASTAAVLLTFDHPTISVPIPEADRRDIAAMYVVAVCGQVARSTH